MPSKKSNKKTPSKPSNSDQISILSSPFEQNQQQLLSSLDEAAAQFPSLISREAFVGTVVDDAVSDSTGGCKIWMSEPAMVSSSIPPGSLVSVSLSSFDKGPSSFPLSALSDECAQCFGFDLTDNIVNEPGNFFALATVFPSVKVLKSGVRLSLNLSHTLGCPRPGRTVFVYPVKRHTLTENGSSDHSLPAASCISFDILSPVYSKGKDGTEISVSSHLGLSNELAYRQDGNSSVSSPKTPSLPVSKVSSPSSTQSRTLNYEKSSSKRTYLSNAASNVIELEEFLRDDSSRKDLELSIASWLSSRSLLSGNFVTVPVFSELWASRVIGPRRLPSNSEILNSNEKYGSSSFSINSGTKIIFLSAGNPIVETSTKSYFEDSDARHASIRNSYEADVSKLGGLSKEFSDLKAIIVSSPLQTAVASMGLRPIKGVLLHGPPGTGKTTLARVCCRDAGVKMFSVNGPEIISQYHGETEQALNEVFENASKASPAVVFIDELDAIAPARKDGGDELSQRMVATLLNLMDGISRDNGVLVLAATNRLDSIEPALRRDGRFGREIEIGVPSPIQRREILLALLSEMRHSLSDKDIQNLAADTHGFVGADLAALCREAGFVHLREYDKSNVRHGNSDYEISTVVDAECQASSQSQELHVGGNPETPLCLKDSRSNLCSTSNSETDESTCMDALRVTSDDFEKARMKIRPSAMREIILEIPKVSWDDVGGQNEVKNQLMEAVRWPKIHKDDMERIGVEPPKGILLYGPPGCSKTLLARAVASEAGLNFLAVKGPELFSKWVGESEKAIRSLFAKARMNAPSIIFFDEIDGLAITRGKESNGVSVGDRVISQLLVELDGVQGKGDVIIIAATNRPDKIDPAIIRDGRFDRVLFVGLPSKKDREDIFRVHLRHKSCSSDIRISELALLTEGYSGADIALVCREAVFAAIDEDRSAEEITMEHLKAGIRQVQPSSVEKYDQLIAKFQRLVPSIAKEGDWESEPGPSIALWNRLTRAVLFLFRLPGFFLRQGSS